ncbi:UNVERIFIED_CONTAM: phosphatidylinositol-binding protein scs2 [Siphonaria sp. JEL0065]|nr:phosphatidylinositol-binding protein scs2 [Siphonaria sp. JEL0065]
MSLSVAEDGLEFRRPFNSVVKQHIHLKNVAGDGIIAFKIKTTAPKQYCVRPNAGIITAGDTREVEVLLQAMKDDPPLDFKCKDKFLVQSIVVPADVLAVDGETQSARLAEFWARADDAKKGGDEGIVSEKKLRCAFLPPFAADVPQVPLPSSTVTSQKISPSEFNPPASLSDRELKDAKEAIKRLTNACEGYKSEIERLSQLRQRRLNEEKAGSAVGASSGVGQLQTQNGQVLSLPLAIALAIIAFILGAVLF